MCNNCKHIYEKRYDRYMDTIKKSFDGKYYCNKCAIINKNNTNVKKYGSKSPLINEKIKEKSINTLMKNYGVDNISKAEYIKKQRSEFMKINTNEYNEIIHGKYGSNVSKLDFIKEKKKETMIKNWGVANPSQNIDLFEKAQISGKKINLHKCGLYYRGSYERDFLDHCYENNILVEKGPTINFNLNGKKKYYHSDFFIRDKNLVAEIKSTYYYEKYKELNLQKEKYTIENGYNFLFIIDKKYSF